MIGHMAASVLEVLALVFNVAAFTAVLEAYLYAHFSFYDRRGFVAAATAGAAVSTAACWLWLGLAPGTGLALTAGAAAAEAAIAVFFKRVVRGEHMLPAMLLAPSVVGLALLIVYPFCFQVYLAFHDLKLTTIMHWSRTGELPFVGLKHFVRVFQSSPLSEASFWRLFGRTLWWTVLNVSLHVAGGMGLALLLNRDMRFKGLYRALLIVPWAMPQIVAVLALRGEFHSQYGFVNAMIAKLSSWLPFLTDLGVGPVQWLSQHAFLTCTIINVWLGIPFMMVVILGGLQSISQHYYDAAAIDGASAFQQFRLITLPLLKPVLAPAVTLGTVWTFNNINVIYLVTGQAGGQEDADILVSALYKAAFTYYRYSYSAAFALIIFAILFAASLVWLRASKAAESVYD